MSQEAKETRREALRQMEASTPPPAAPAVTAENLEEDRKRGEDPEGPRRAKKLEKRSLW